MADKEGSAGRRKESRGLPKGPERREEEERGPSGREGSEGLPKTPKMLEKERKRKQILYVVLAFLLIALFANVVVIISLI